MNSPILGEHTGKENITCDFLPTHDFLPNQISS